MLWETVTNGSTINVVRQLRRSDITWPNIGRIKQFKSLEVERVVKERVAKERVARERVTRERVARERVAR